MLVLITKVNVDNRRTGLLEIFYKDMEEMINKRIKSLVQFQNVLHGFRAGREAGTAIMDIKLA